MASPRQRNRKRAQRAHHADSGGIVPLFTHLLEILDGKRPMPTSDAKFQHYVPQLHLRGFSPNPWPTADAVIWQLDKKRDVIERKRVARVGGENRFNRVKGVDDQYTNVLEAWLGLVEGYAAPALERLVSTKARPSKHDRITIAFYLAMQSGRTPLGLRRIQQVTQLIVDATIELATHDEDLFAHYAREAGVEQAPEVVEGARRRIREANAIKLKEPRSEAFRSAIRRANSRTSSRP
jgi:hypothetical protein